MNILHLKYAVEISKCNSINKAAENLYMSQPNLSRALKELEESLGITVFYRTSKGMSPTPQGEEFLGYAKKILNQIDEVENLYKNNSNHKQCFSVSVPRTSYISHAFSEFVKHISTEHPAEIFYKETNAVGTINNITQSNYKLGIIRYQSGFDKHFKEILDEKDLRYELICEFSYRLLLSEKSPLANADNIDIDVLKNYIEICHADPYIPQIPALDMRKAEFSEEIDKRIYVYERGSQFDLLSKVPKTFMWVSPVPTDILLKYGLVEKKVGFNKKIYKDMLIYKKDYKLSALDNIFIDEICKVKREYI